MLYAKSGRSALGVLIHMKKKKPLFVHDAVYGDAESRRAHEERQLEAFESWPELVKEIQDWKQTNKPSEERDVNIIKLHQNLREVGEIEKEHANHVIFCAVERIADWKTTDPDYAANKAKMSAIKVKSDLDIDKIYAGILNDFGEIELAHLLLNNKEEFDRIMGIGEKQRIEAENEGRDIH